MENIRNLKQNEIPKLLYLDQNQWVELEKVEYQQREDEATEEILSMLRLLVSSNKLIIPIDINRLIETSHRSLSFTRERLSKLMIELSKEYAVLAFVYVEELEIRNYINRKRGLNEVNLKEVLINQNVENLLAGTPEIVGNKSSDDIQKINKEINRIISTTNFKKYVISTSASRNSAQEQEFVQNAENARAILKTMNTDKQRKDYLISVDFQVLIRKIMETYKLTDDYEGKISDFEKLYNLLLIRTSLPLPLHSIKEKVSFMQEFPLNYTHRTLVSFRDRNLDRPIQSNDLIDIMQYVVPLVYFHYIVGERYFMTLANQAKLNLLYNTTLYRKLSELKPYLELLENE